MHTYQAVRLGGRILGRVEWSVFIGGKVAWLDVKGSCPPWNMDPTDHDGVAQEDNIGILRQPYRKSCRVEGVL